MDSYDFEYQLVGSMLVKGDHIDCREVAGKLPAEAFENFHLRTMYQSIVTLLTKAEPVDMFTVQAAVPDGTKDLVIEVGAKCVTAANIRGWAKRVRQCWMLRRGIAELNRAAGILASAGTHDINDRIGEVGSILSKLQFETNDKLPRRIADLLEDYMDVLESRMQGEESGLYLKTGIQALDDEYGGFDRTDLIVVAARPGMGKTEFAINIANSIGRQKGKGLFVSLEMSDMQVVERHVADRSGLSIGALRNPLNMIQEQYTRLTTATGTLMDENNYVIDGSFTVDDCIAHAERLNSDGGLSFLAIDYLGLLEKPKAERNDIAIAEITRKLKQFCLRNKVPVILLSQLNRGVEGRADKRPTLADLKDSGAIEQDADVIIFPYRDEVYHENSDMKGIAEIIIGKYRSGEPKTFYMGWKNGHFVNIDQQEAAMQYARNEKQSSQSNDWR
ncbi:replicative DNA helicase [Cronobacter turicensis]|uniref:DNA 5'-3' helicase n=1 Tax=Cronobacter turicensis (strain DSM 18703 / CCUG 55852 / LMG 23827 / z3032) TaxID=693216 RepID=C9XY11_CROTZ|nr:replicative DNA helicase [Cronobacter turicensis]MDI6470659.1 replicative DNA helicase [Cronobacter turicensis]CBA28893.1 Replicative DNA helicase [Cronobacter turicensis z3032]